MPVTKQVYSAAATWTATQLADMFRSAFIDAGYMAEWYAAFTNGSFVNRVMEVTYNAGATYGKTYYWFIFTTSGTPGVYVAVCSGWNTSTNVPTGTQYLDYGSTGTNTISWHHLITVNGLSTGTMVDLTRYTSQVNSSHSWFLFRNGTSTSSQRAFSISPSSHQPASWLDLSKGLFHHFISVEATTSLNLSGISFNSRYIIRRSVLGGSVANGNTNSLSNLSLFTAGYFAPGRGSNNTNNYGVYGFSTGSPGTGAIMLPTGQNASNPAYAADYNPVCTGMPYSFYLANASLPSDFGIAVHYANNTLTALDRFVVSLGVEEWEMLVASNNATANIGPSLAFCARVV